ncbi:hypothetical protein HETIRDRAFT_453398 [Heterobasidion irregulare TC 32-1]|uniref:Uncharacterized protein n=1 Tax=Heterobasidion irregulare (strain TC 32-1) TaxID=747525 RepID=W4K175_HETIT|nr:uncharacterized protein HETIRDRAFT_453398 [Heterobasidion irregulare TC 32-1]ETW78826.1 hypothetical protein HETIRDRAFT_453398 [Heterobasidion irregulare TC 32-1]
MSIWARWREGGAVVEGVEGSEGGRGIRREGRWTEEKSERTRNAGIWARSELSCPPVRLIVIVPFLLAPYRIPPYSTHTHTHTYILPPHCAAHTRPPIAIAIPPASSPSQPVSTHRPQPIRNPSPPGPPCPPRLRLQVPLQPRSPPTSASTPAPRRPSPGRLRRVTARFAHPPQASIHPWCAAPSHAPDTVSSRRPPPRATILPCNEAPMQSPALQPITGPSRTPLRHRRFWSAGQAPPRARRKLSSEDNAPLTEATLEAPLAPSPLKLAFLPPQATHLGYLGWRNPTKSSALSASLSPPLPLARRAIRVPQQKPAQRPSDTSALFCDTYQKKIKKNQNYIQILRSSLGRVQGRRSGDSCLPPSDGQRSASRRVASDQVASPGLTASPLVRPPPSSPGRAPPPQRPPTASDVSTNAFARLATAPGIPLAAGAHAPPRSAAHADPDLDAWISASASRARVSVSQRARAVARRSAANGATPGHTTRRTRLRGLRDSFASSLSLSRRRGAGIDAASSATASSRPPF